MARDDDEKRRNLQPPVALGGQLADRQAISLPKPTPSLNQFGRDVRTGADKAGNFVDRNITQPLINTNQAIGSAVASGTKDFFRGLGNLPPAQAAVEQMTDNLPAGSPTTTQPGKSAGAPVAITDPNNGQQRYFQDQASAFDALKQLSATPVATLNTQQGQIPTAVPPGPATTPGAPLPRPGADNDINVIRGTSVTRTNPGRDGIGVEYVPGFDRQTGVALAQLGSLARNASRGLGGGKPVDPNIFAQAQAGVAGGSALSARDQASLNLDQKRLQQANRGITTAIDSTTGKPAFVREADLYANPGNYQPLPQPGRNLQIEKLDQFGEGGLPAGQTLVAIGQDAQGNPIVQQLNPQGQQLQNLQRLTSQGKQAMAARYKEVFGRDASPQDPAYQQWLISQGVDPNG